MSDMDEVFEQPLILPCERIKCLRYPICLTKNYIKCNILYDFVEMDKFLYKDTVREKLVEEKFTSLCILNPEKKIQGCKYRFGYLFIDKETDWFRDDPT